VRSKRWTELSPRARRLILIGCAVDGALKAAALVDLARRPATDVHGSKRRWVLAVALINSVGVVPLAYFVVGRRSKPA
jgi:hypothetical protein